MRKAIALLVFLIVGAAASIIAVSTPVAICATIWRYEAIESLIGPRSDRSHPATWAYPCLAAFCGLVTLAGCLALYIPLIRLVPWLDLSRHDLPSKSLHPVVYKWMRRSLDWERRFVLAWMHRIRADIRDLERA